MCLVWCVPIGFLPEAELAACPSLWLATGVSAAAVTTAEIPTVPHTHLPQRRWRPPHPVFSGSTDNWNGSSETTLRFILYL